MVFSVVRDLLDLERDSEEKGDGYTDCRLHESMNIEDFAESEGFAPSSCGLFNGLLVDVYCCAIGRGM